MKWKKMDILSSVIGFSYRIERGIFAVVILVIVMMIVYIKIEAKYKN